MIHKEGTATLLIVGVVFVVFGFLAFNFLPIVLFYIVLAILVGFYIFFLQFFRNPKRIISDPNDKIVYAPADGKVVVIEEVEESEYFKDKRRQISIFMSPLNVHANRAPFSGKVKYAEYHKGKYLVAWHPKSSTENERTSIVIENKHSSILLRQIAGALARRIVYYVKKGDNIKQGEEFGFIKLGSRVDIFLPLNAEILVNLDQMVKGNIDKIARIP